MDIFFDYMAILLDGLNPEVRKFTASIKMIVEDHESELERELVLKYYELNVENCVINHTQLDEDDEDNAESIYDTTVNIKKMTLYNLVGAIAAGTCTNPSKVLKELKDNNDITISGDEWRFVFILNHLQALDVNFNLVTPVDLCR
ncbi:MAG: hypothetical protein GY749_01575 [Desulfobacteraceae bacterium]|nr:hypothetical protein [Desulfobacteraceae bacterium]